MLLLRYFGILFVRFELELVTNGFHKTTKNLLVDVDFYAVRELFHAVLHAIFVVQRAQQVNY